MAVGEIVTPITGESSGPIYGFKDNKCRERIDNLVKYVEVTLGISIPDDTNLHASRQVFATPEGYTPVGVRATNSESWSIGACLTGSYVGFIVQGNGTAQQVTAKADVYCVRTDFTTEQPFI